MAGSTSKKDTILTIHFVIMMVLMIGIGLLPPFSGITELGMDILAVFIGTLYGWMFLDFIVSSALGMLFLGLYGYTSVLGAFQAGISNQVVLMMLIAFGFVAVLNELNLTGAMASTLLNLKFTKGRPWAIVFMLFFAAWLISAFADTLAAFLLFWSIVYKIADQVGYERYSKEMGYLITGIIFFAAIGAYMFPFKPAILGFSAGYVAVMGPLDYNSYYVGYFIINVGMFIAYMLIGRLAGLDISKLNIDLSEYAGGAAWDARAKWGLFFTLFFILYLSLPVFLPATPFVTAWKGSGIIGATVIIVATAYVVRVDGERLVPNPAKLWKEATSWDLIFMIMATMVIGDALRSPDGGIITSLMAWLTTVIGEMNWVVFTIICMVALGLLTQIAHNLIIAAVLFPVFAPICANMGGDPMLWFMIMFLTINAAFTTPAASGWAAMLHGNREWMTPQTSYTFGFATLVAMWVGCILLIPIWLMIF